MNDQICEAHKLPDECGFDECDDKAETNLVDLAKCETLESAREATVWLCQFHYISWLRWYNGELETEVERLSLENERLRRKN